MRTPRVSTDTEQSLHEFVQGAIPLLADLLKRREAEWRLESSWKRGPDGHFREQTKRTRILFPPFAADLLHSLPRYHQCIDRLQSDALVAPHLDRLVGTVASATLLGADNILWSLIGAMLDEEGTFTFTEERFAGKWGEVVTLFKADRIPFKTIAPLPYLALPSSPLQLNEEIVLDHFTEDEVTRCCEVGILQPPWRQFPLIESDLAVGIRKVDFRSKIVATGEEARTLPDEAKEGSFGNRPALRDDLLVDDVLSALRLFKHANIRCAGYASWTDSFYLSQGTSYRVLQQWPRYRGKYCLLNTELEQFTELWRLLENAATRFNFSIHRFNLAFERGLLVDRIVDLVISAESLFLSDRNMQDRGELRFRFALRAAKFIEHPTYSEHDIFRVMRRAYDARSAVVHGGSPKETRLPDNESANLHTFTDTVEQLVRLAIRKALSMKEDGKNLGNSEYWNKLVLSN